MLPVGLLLGLVPPLGLLPPGLPPPLGHFFPPPPFFFFFFFFFFFEYGVRPSALSSALSRSYAYALVSTTETVFWSPVLPPAVLPAICFLLQSKDYRCTFLTCEAFTTLHQGLGLTP